MSGFDNKIRMGFIGDVHAFSGNSGFRYVYGDYINNVSMMDYMFILGDITYDAAEAEFQTIKDMADKWPAKTYAIMGNHDYKNKFLTETERTEYQQMFTNIFTYEPHYTVHIGNIAFIMLSTDGVVSGDASYPGLGFMTAETKTWLEGELAVNQNKIVFLCCHQPPYVTGQWATERPSNTYKNADEFQSILSTYRVDVLLYAHCHQAYKNGVVDISEPYTGDSPEFLRTSPKSAAPIIVTNGSNNTVMVPCWGGNKFYGKKTVESRYIEFTPGSNQIVIKARDHVNGIWQEIVNALNYTVTLPMDFLM